MTRTRVTCLDCGTEFVRPNGYDGNYCPECHESWTTDDDDRGSTDGPEPRRLRRGTKPSVRRLDDRDADAPSRYDEE
ncbi:DUF7564 family protein [Halobellus limi]|uniref:Small CPxCG-related zinc finger protein n=1 Tax=Halobellus limi TaxID=699433 RepID=A0A1H6C4T9_9EURY|nr:hypothetical protein [Halobellus limi]QCC48600.1 hypothetical protein DV707_13545 [Halobellus limi]SEG67655.1 hypothetical protein SAMN04488133_3198 [Halobellus limi]